METEHLCPSCQKPLPPSAPRGLCPECLMKAGFGTGCAPEAGQPSQAPKFVPPSVAELARLFPQFEILELLGQGGMGAVYKARQPALDRLVALKILPPQTGTDPGFAERFTREARALARLSHPNIVAVYEYGRVDSLHYFVMEYVEGPNLRQLQLAGKLSPREALQIVPQICEALQFAHDEGVVHRDIKPENVLVDRKGRVKIADFGVAKILGQETQDMRLTGAKDVVGTPHYMAPEQIERPQEVDHRADIYSLGVVFYEMLTGELPLGKFAAPSHKVQVDVRLDEVVLHSLEKEPARRYQHASQVKSDVETIAGSAAQQPRTPTAALADIQRQVRLPATWLAVASLAHLLLVIIGSSLLMFSLRAMLLAPVMLLLAVLPLLTFLGALRMRQLKNYGFAITASILAMIGTGLLLPFGIWALVVLLRPEVRAAFEGQRARRFEPAQAGAGGGSWKLAAIIVAVVLMPIMLLLGGVALIAGVRVLSRVRAVPAPAQAPQPGPHLLVRGTVRDALTGKPIAGARVDDNSYGSDSTRPPRQAWTDATGHYQLYTWREEHTLAASASGYQTGLETLTAGSQRQSVELNFQLQPAERDDAAGSNPVVQTIPQRVRQGSEAWSRGDYPEALRLLLPAARQGDAVAQHRLGVMYVMGQGVEQDFTRAVDWFRQAADQGQGESQFSMGMRYLQGEGVPQDSREAARWFTLAANQGVGWAASCLAQMYATGQGVAQDFTAAYKWLALAGDQVEPTRVTVRLDRLADKLTAEQFAEAQQQVQAFVPKRIGPADLY